MSNNKRIAIIKKIAETVIFDKNAPYHQQRTRLDQFSHDLYMKYKILLNEMEGDLQVLKEQNFSKDMWKIFAKLWIDIFNIYKEYNPQKPYAVANKLIEFVENKKNKAIIDNLIYLINDHLKRNSVDFMAGPMLQPAKIKSLDLLQSFAKKLVEYIKNNPLLPIPSEAPIKEPEILNKDKEEFSPFNIGNEDETYVPPVKL